MGGFLRGQVLKEPPAQSADPQARPAKTEARREEAAVVTGR